MCDSVEESLLLKNGTFQKNLIQPGKCFLKITTRKQILTKITSVRVNNFDLVNRFAYLIVETRKLTYKITFERISLVNITVLTSLDVKINKITNKKLKINTKINLKLFKNKKRKRSEIKDEITSQKFLKQDNNNNNRNVILVNNNNNNKRGGSPIIFNAAKRLKLIPETTSVETQTQDEIADENHMKWSYFRCDSLTQGLNMMKREWGVKNLSNKHTNLTRVYYSKENQPKRNLENVKCTLIFNSTIKNMQRNERKLIHDMYSLRRRLAKCRYSSLEYFNLERKIRGLRQKANEINNYLAVLNEAEKEIEKINRIYKEDCPSYPENVSIITRFDLDICKRFYTL